jgi:cyclopropane fatty-acyl-phospholipid synthase-like methyltransferase
MQANHAAVQGQQKEWYRYWFDTTYYHQLYANRDDRQAADFIDRLIDRLLPEAGASVLDLGCGAGRHSRHLASKGFDVTGIDLSERSISLAKRFESKQLRFHRHDMRNPYWGLRFDMICSFFTSFGYFGEDEHSRILRNIADAIVPGGVFVLDYLNTSYADARLVPAEVREIDGVRYRIARWADADHFFKRISIEDGGMPVEYTEQVARFSASTLEEMLQVEGLVIEEVFGDYMLTPYDGLLSPRLIVVARKPEDHH